MKDETDGDVEKMILKGWGVFVMDRQTNRLTNGWTFIIVDPLLRLKMKIELRKLPRSPTLVNMVPSLSPVSNWWNTMVTASLSSSVKSPRGFFFFSSFFTFSIFGFTFSVILLIRNYTSIIDIKNLKLEITLFSLKFYPWDPASPGQN